MTEERPAIHPTDIRLGENLLDQEVLYCLACNTKMVPHFSLEYICTCDPDECGWHHADIRTVAACYRRFEVPEGHVPDTVWVIPGTGRVPGVVHRKLT